MKRSIVLGALLSAGLFVCGQVAAATIHWTDWLSNGLPDTITGVIDVGGESVGVTFEGTYLSAQYGSGTNYWTHPTTYTSPEVDNAPSTTDIIQLNQGGEFRITFSRPVLDPVFALVSWNGNTVDFGAPIEILSNGPGYWGSGTPVLNLAGTGFHGDGEVHGVVGLTGQYGTIRVSHTTEGWHGFTIGVRDVARDAAQVPAPAPLLLLGLGAFLLGSFSTLRAQR